MQLAANYLAQDFLFALPQMCNGLLVAKCKTIIDSGQFLNQENQSWGRWKNCSRTAELATNPQREDAIAADDALLQYWGSLARTMRPGMTGVTVLLSWEKQGKNWEIGSYCPWNDDSRKSYKTRTNLLAQCKRTSMRVNNSTTWVSSYELEWPCPGTGTSTTS